MCSVSGCDREAQIKSRGVCRKHYNALPDQKEKRRERERQRYREDESYRSQKIDAANKYYRDNSSRVQARNRESRQGYESTPQRKQYKREYLAQNHEAFARRRAQRRARELAADTRLVTEKDQRRLLHAYGSACAYCRETFTSKPEWDHVIPLHLGGRHAIGNLVPTCRTCNRSKSCKLLSEWRHRRRLDAVLLSTAL